MIVYALQIGLGLLNIRVHTLIQLKSKLELTKIAERLWFQKKLEKLRFLRFYAHPKQKYEGHDGLNYILSNLSIFIVLKLSNLWYKPISERSKTATQ